MKTYYTITFIDTLGNRYSLEKDEFNDAMLYFDELLKDKNVSECMIFKETKKMIRIEIKEVD